MFGMSFNLKIVFVVLALAGQGSSFRLGSLKHVSRVQSSRLSSTEVDTIESTESLRPPSVEIDRRRNFAIISHPDAGKTTLTEKLLLFGGAIQDAGAVKSRADQRKSTSDFLQIEQQRGISVTSTVLSFEYGLNDNQYHLNLLDTPGHQDFSEDTYRTLAAADNCVMLIDAAKGIEDRTRKLFEVCRMRRLPVFTFANKMDRPSLTPFEIIDQLEKEFNLVCCPMNWPIGSGEDFQGVYDIATKQIHLFQRGDRRKKITANVVDIEEPALPELIGETLFNQLLEDIDVLETMIEKPDTDRILSGDQTPLFFGSAMTNFGVELFLKTFLQFARKPEGRVARILAPPGSADDGSNNKDAASEDETENNSGLPGDIYAEGAAGDGLSGGTLQTIAPDSEEFTGFVFKLQANLDPRHRDRMAFIRVCSGTFRKGLKVGHSRLKKTINLANAQSLFAQDRETITEAYPGDVIGIHNPGHFAIGDTIYTGNKRIVYPGIPSFSPEKFAYLRNPNPSAYKKFQKGLSELLDEGAVQMLRERYDYGNGTPILAAVGQLQFEVVEYRLKAEYGVDSRMESLGYTMARWVEGGWDAIEKADADGKLFGVYVVKDRWGRPVLLFRNPWKVTQLQDEVDYLKLLPWSMPPSEM